MNRRTALIIGEDLQRLARRRFAACVLEHAVFYDYLRRTGLSPDEQRWLKRRLGLASYDATSNSGVVNGTSGHVTWTHTCASSAVLVVGVAWALDAFGTPTGVTYNSSAMTAGGAAQMVATNYGVRQWYHATPASGANTVDVSVNGPDVICGAVSATSAGTPTGYITASGSSTTPSVTVSSPGSSDLLVDTVLSVSSISSVGANQTSRWNLGPAAIGFYGGGSTQSGADGGVMSWTSSATDNWAIAAINIPNSGGGGGGITYPELEGYLRGVSRGVRY